MDMLYRAAWIVGALCLTHCSADATGTQHSDPPAERDAGAGSSRLDAGEPAHRRDASSGPTSPGSLDSGLLPTPPDAGATGPGTTRFGPLPPQNPGAAPDGLATQHGDTAASDSTPLPGPGAVTVSVKQLPLLAACPSILISADGYPFAVCTQITNQTPAIYLLDPESGNTLATMSLSKGNLFGGVYPYLDQRDNLVVVDAEQNLLHVVHSQDSKGAWQLTVASSLSLATPACAGCDGVVGLAPGYDGGIWFATANGKVGRVDPDNGSFVTVALPDGELVGNGIASAPEGIAVVTDHALYLLGSSVSGAPEVRSRAAYDRGPARKPGQLSYGSGSTPTFFGPASGSEFLTITDNAVPVMNLLVFRASDLNQRVCSLALPAPAGDGSENSPIGSGRSVFVASTYGYPYAALPDGSEASMPASAPVYGGMTRVDVAPDGQSCAVVWTNAIRSAAVPKLSLADRLIYTIERKLVLGSEMASPLDGFAYTTIDPLSGNIVTQQTLPNSTDTMQLAGTLGPKRVLYQGTITGLLRITPAP